MHKILVIGYVWPEPNSSAAGVHMVSLLRAYVEEGWQVVFASPAQQSEHMVDLAAEGITQQSISLNCDSFDIYIKQYQPTLVHFDRFMMEEQFGWRVDLHCPEALKILDTVDLQFLRGARQQAHKQDRKVVKEDLYSDFAKREIAAILRSDIALIISGVEMTLLIEKFKIDPAILHYLPFLVDLEQLPKKTLTFKNRQHFMTIGNFRHAPNWDAVLYLQSIWPKIRQQLPEAELHIYGAYPPPKATNINNKKTGFLIKGWAESTTEVMQQSRICLAPLRFGAGLKGKLLDAMIMQTPSVTTMVGAEGMTLDKAEWPGTIADEEADFVSAAVSLYNDQKKWEIAQESAHQHISENFDRSRFKQTYLDKIKTVYKDLSQHRLNNFTGAMLKHHTMRSTQYMSQWITEKNKRES